MRRSTERILSTHVGALPGPLDTWEGVRGRRALRSAVDDVVAAQLTAGTDIVNEGELTKGGNWVTFINSRLSGFEGVPAEGTVALMRSSLDWQEFDDFYLKAMAGGTLFEQTASTPVQTSRIRDWVCRAPIEYTGQAALQREIDLLKAALGQHSVGDAFLTSTAPASVEVGRKNEYYDTEEEFLYALADALKVEYEMIAKAGLLVQIDDAWLPALWDRIGVQDGSRGLPTLLHAARRGAESRARQRAARAGALPPLLGQLARAARARHSAGRHGRDHAGRERADLSLRGGQCAPRARVRALGARQAARRTRSWRPASSAIRRR